MLTPAEILRNWRQQQPSNQGDIDSSATRKLGESITWGGEFLILFLHYTT
jgi:hypothetical protein